MSGRPFRRGLAEVGGTALLVGIGTGAIVGSARFGPLPLGWIALAWFAAVTVPVVAFVRVSGAHLNPVVTLALAASGRIAWSEAPAYILSQFAGAFVGSAAVLATLGRGARLGATVPVAGALLWAFVGEVAFTALLVTAVFTLADTGEGVLRHRLLLPGATVALSTYILGPWSGSSLNPARSLAPAVLSGDLGDLWLYALATTMGALAVAVVWRPRAVDRLDRGSGRIDARR